MTVGTSMTPGLSRHLITFSSASLFVTNGVSSVLMGVLFLSFAFICYAHSCQFMCHSLKVVDSSKTQQTCCQTCNLLRCSGFFQLLYQSNFIRHRNPTINCRSMGVT